MTANKQLIHNIAIYMRISKEDGDTEESESITNQRKIILDYIDKNFIYEKYYEYIDDGISGATFDRPNFKNMINQLKENNIELVITKNLARFGRNYIECGEYIEEIFPNNRVRYIAILDGIDNYEEKIDNDFAPIKSVFNELYCKETSKSVKNSKRKKMLEGYYACTVAPFGYKKDLENSGKLIIDKKAAKTVRRIFNLALEGKTCKNIADILNKKKVKTPSEYLEIRGLETRTKKIWTRTCVMRILNNLVYLGKTVRNKSQKISYKSKQRIYNKKDELIIIDNTHEAIISEEIYKEIHKNSKYGCTLNSREIIIAKFSKYIYCESCKQPIAKRRSRNYISIMCPSRNETELLCTNKELYKYELVEEKIIEKIQKKFDEYFKKYDKDIRVLQKHNEIKINEIKNDIKKLSNDIRKINFEISKLYNQRLLEDISEEEYANSYKKVVQIRKELNNEMKNKEEELSQIEINGETNQKYEKAKKILKYLNTESLSEEDIGELIDRIEISGHNIHISYKFEDMESDTISC